jgi:hypothetical protein
MNMRGFYDKNLNINKVNILYSPLYEKKKATIKNIHLLR